MNATINDILFVWHQNEGSVESFLEEEKEKKQTLTWKIQRMLLGKTLEQRVQVQSEIELSLAKAGIFLSDLL